jgi:predicted transcriptional regulator
MTGPLTLWLDTATSKRLDKLAKRTNRSREALTVEAVVQFVETNEWQIAAIDEGARAADNNQFIDHARLKTKWEKKLAAALVKTI